MRYKDAGVDLSKHRRIHEAASALLGGRAGAYARWVEVGGTEVALHVDGVGTKALWLLEAGRLETAGWDCVVVNVNDVVCDGFKPVAVVDYIALSPGLEERAVEILAGVKKAIDAMGAVLLGGETAIMPDVVNGVDAVCTVLAVREASTSPIEPGDYAIGLESTGPHANGFSLLRRLFRLDDKICGSDAAEVLLAPVASYHRVLDLMKEGLVKAAAHITGGGFSKLRRTLGELGAELQLGELPCWAEAAMRRGVPIDEMYKVFNMGVGMVLFSKHPKEAVRRAEDLGLSARVIGRVKPEGPVLVDGIRVG